VRDHRMAEQLYRRAAKDAKVSHPSHWFLIRHLLRQERSTQATELAMEEDSASLPGFLRQSVVAYETSKELPDQALFERIIRGYTPVSGRSLADAATLWHTVFPGPKPDWVQSPLWTLGQARHLVDPGDRDRAAALYATLLGDKDPAANPPPQDQPASTDLRGQATMVIGALRGLGRLPPQPGQPELREQWRRWYSRLSNDQEFRKQYLVFLKLSTDPQDAAEAEQLRNEFEASRASTLSVT
jgi:hypothetical protein